MRYRESYFADGPKKSEEIVYRNVKKIFEKKMAFQRVQILDFPVYGRALVLDGEIQSAVSDEFIYHEALVHPAMTGHPIRKKF